MENEQPNNKKNIVKFLLILFLVAIFFLWLANLKNVFRSTSRQESNTWEQINSDIDKTFKEIENNFDKEVNSTSQEFVSDLLVKASSTAEEKASTSTVKEEIAEDLKSIIATSTDKKQKTNCPLYINCMPSIDEVRSCVIPVGCEEITQIAY
jgi:hypothetical protein